MIEGIRNFGTQQHYVIEFFHPLTVIVGPNGSGKTVRESRKRKRAIQFFVHGFRPLSNACDTSQPASFLQEAKEGHSFMILKFGIYFSLFISSFQIAGETEVLAQIRLKMHNVAGQVVVVTRRLQSSQKKKKLEMKTLEGLIQREDPSTGAVKNISTFSESSFAQKTSLSSKCADLDREVSNLLLFTVLLS